MPSDGGLEEPIVNLPIFFTHHRPTSAALSAPGLSSGTSLLAAVTPRVIALPDTICPVSIFRQVSTLLECMSDSLSSQSFYFYLVRRVTGSEDVAEPFISSLLT